MTIHGKPVLVATDLCARTDRAVDWATQLAREWDVRLMVLHAIEPDSRLYARPKLANEAMREVLPDPRADVRLFQCDKKTGRCGASSTDRVAPPRMNSRSRD